MAILISIVRREAINYDELVLEKLATCYEAMKFFKDSFFIPQTAELWYNAPSEALGGEQKKELTIKDLFETRQVLASMLKNTLFQDLRKTIIIFRGVWKIENAELAGYFSIQNAPEWRKVYGDIEISAYPKGEIEDLVDALWLTTDVQGIIDHFIDDLNRGMSTLKIGLSQVVFYRGIWNKDDPTGIMAILLTGERRGLLRIFYEARRKEKSWDMEPMARPLDTSFLLDTLEKADIVRDRINERLEKDVIAELPAGSKLYIAKQRDSFEKLYDDISRTIIKPALAKLPKDESVRNQIEEGLKDYKES
jgi:hypothetical protein